MKTDILTFFEKKRFCASTSDYLSTMEDKNPWNGYGNLPSTSLTYQMFRCSIIIHFSNHLGYCDWPSPPPSKQCWDEETLLGQGKVYRGAQTTTLLEGEGEKLRQIMLIVLRTLSSIV